jgi:DNA-binding transcriptional LysR family regulator
MPIRHYNGRVELRQLRYFIAVAEALSFTKAAQKLHIAQPALSRQIRQLEEEIDVQLLLRDRRSVELTDAGRVFLKEAKAVINQATHALDMVRRSRRGDFGRVRIGIASGLSSQVNRALIEHAKRCPGVEVECRDILSTLQNEALRGRTIDVGFLRPPVDLRHLHSEVLFTEQFMVFLRKSNPLAKRKRLRLEQIAHEPLLLNKPNVSTGVYDKALDLYKRAGIRPTVIHTDTAPYEEAGTVLLASGKGVYLGVGAVIGHPELGSGVAVVPLDEPDATIEVHAAWRKNEKSQAVLAFLNSVRRVLKNH